MTTFYLVRHAEKNGTDVLAGRTPNVRLSARGRRQAELLPTLIANAPITRVISSPIERARETAAPLAAARGLAVEVSDAWTEMDLGRFTGFTPAQLADDPDWRRFNEFRSGTRAPGGESMLDVQARVIAAMQRACDENPEAHLALVSHAEPIRAALLHYLGMPLDLFWRLEISLASVSIVEVGERHARVLAVNRTLDQAGV